LKSEEEVFNGEVALDGKENTDFGGFFLFRRRICKKLQD
jgi:hypothetical protein